jgi:ADP-dependent NAD(P)H-hydrate dehydratase
MLMSNRETSKGREINRPLLKEMALPVPSEDSDKEERGRVLIVGGGPEMPGAVILAGTAALRAGAGKLRVATCASISTPIAVEIPEARVFALPECEKAGIGPAAAPDVVKQSNDVDAVVFGPGVASAAAFTQLLSEALPKIVRAAIVLDAAALEVLRESVDAIKTVANRLVITPHAGEMANLMGISKEEVERNREGFAAEIAARFGAVVALKGSETAVASPDGKLYRNCAGNVGLATSGSGDVLAGIIGGLLARGASPLISTIWGVAVHARAGDRLADKVGPVGYLARELVDEVPSVMAEL